MKPSKVVYDCDRCGLCCEKLIIEASLADALREQRIAAECQHMDGHGRVRLVDSCFSIACGEARPCPFASRDADRRHTCGIYPTRPDVCVQFQAGSSQCRDLRARHGLDPLAPRPAASLLDRIAVVART